MKTVIIIILVALAVVAVGIGIFILAIYILMYVVASGISYKNKTEQSAWDYWEQNKVHKWCDLSSKEQERMVVVCMIIADDIGMVTTEDNVKKMLQQQLPITEPNVGLAYS